MLTAQADVKSRANARRAWSRSVLRHDLPASLVVFLVALPLSLGIAVASGAPVLAGLIAAIVGGLVVGALGGSPLQVSGPAAGLTVIVADLVGRFGWKVTCAITVGAGVLQVLLGLSRVARAALAISPVVVHAMLAGIGITITLQQLLVLLGGRSASSAWENLARLPEGLIESHGAEPILGILVIMTMLAWRSVPGPLGRIPGPLVAIAGATVLSLLFSLEVRRITLDGSLLDAVQLPALPDGNWTAAFIGVVTVALIASVESLLSAVSVDRMHTGPRTAFNRELIGQGTANVASGLLGGLPITGVIVRSATNVAAGAKSRASAFLHGVWILLFALPFADLVQKIPTAALAGLLITVGVQLIKMIHIETAWRSGDLVVYLVTVAGVVFLNLLHGVLIGLVLAMALTGWRVIRMKITAAHSDDEWVVTVSGACTFLALPRLTNVLAQIPAGSHVTLAIRTTYIDHAAEQALEDWLRQHCATGGTVLVPSESSSTADAADACVTCAPSRLG
ncbi:SulP family inorganic anion transporter [Mycobacterium sp. SMC-14]|uniref:SulP family inorganic anion transporter n=1 Tax=Mycobacterium sp. SMC-14 TaxID=3385968 RepID=UPI00390C4E0C